MTNQGSDLYNFGLIWRNYDELRNRIFGWNVYGDIDDGYGNAQRKRVGVGMESLGRYLDFYMNGYVVTGNDSVLLSDGLGSVLTFAGNKAFRERSQFRDNAYSGVDFELGGPLPGLGKRGMNMYLGSYWLDSSWGHETVGFSARWQAYLTESATVDVRFTDDDNFGTNSWVSVAYSIPNYRERAIFEPRRVRDRLSDPVYRHNRIHTHIDNIRFPEAVVRTKTGNDWNIVYVDPNGTLAGDGTVENPYNSLQLAADNNNAGVDIIRVVPLSDDSGTNLTVNGGLQLFDCQILLSSTKDYTLLTEGGTDFVLSGTPTATNLGPLISNPLIASAADSVVWLRNSNEVIGMRIDASNPTHTVFGTGISNRNGLPLTDTSVVMNTFVQYDTAVNLQNVSGRAVYDMNTARGVLDMSRNGLILTTASGSQVEVLISNNTVNNSHFTDTSNTTVNTTTRSDATVAGISVTALPNSVILADDPNGFSASGATGILNNVVTNSGDGIVMQSLAGARVDAVVENNQSFNNARNGLMATANAGTFNLYSMRNNLFGGEDLNANGVLDDTEDTNGDGILDAGEDLNGNGILDGPEDVNLNGILDPGEDRNANGLLDAGEDTNGNNLLDVGEDLDQDGLLRPAEDLNGDGLLAAGNGENGAFLHYLNGGRFFGMTEDLNDDTNFNGVQDAGETLGANGVFDVFNGSLSLGEDINGNGRLDFGIVSNNFHDNGVAGLCIVGEGASEGLFTIGGPTSDLGNRFFQNAVAGIGVDLKDTATLNVNSMFNVIGRSARQETILTPVGATFSLAGDTFSAVQTLTNISPQITGASLTSLTNFTWNIATSSDNQSWEFDTERIIEPVFNALGNLVGFNVSNAGTSFTPQANSDILTGLSFVNAVDWVNRVQNNPNPALPTPPPVYLSNVDAALDSAQLLTLNFTPALFTPQEGMVWQVYVDRNTANPNSVFPDDVVTANFLSGTPVSVTFQGDFDRNGVQSLRTLSGV
ncbi:MAG: hypothetical protein KDA89_16115, partial [Planctomycetaceae bacterium]|nr:hypothetical protein [Planctomycetaceae bacterium]